MPVYPGSSSGGLSAPVANSDLADMAAHTFKARNTNSTGAPEDATATQATALLNAATASLPGLMPAANFVKSTNYDFDGWFTGVVTTMKTAAPALTNFREIKLAEFSGATSLTAAKVNDGVKPGGAIGNPTTNVNSVIAAGLFQALKTSSWAVAWRAKLPTSTAGKFNMLGFTDGATNTHDYGVATYSTADATKYLIYTFNGAEVFTASSLACDDLWHTFTMTFDGTTITLFVDGVSKATQTTLTSVTDETVYPCIQGADALAVLASRFAYGYIAP